jgi:hypothetical protein
MADSKQKADAAKRTPPNAGKGRPKGSANKTTTALKDAILEAAKVVGEDGNGKGGLQGYLQLVAKSDVKAFSGLLGKVLPMTVQGAGPNGEHVFNRIVVEVVQAQK